MTRNRVAGLKHRTTLPSTDVTPLVPKGLRVSAALSWRFLVIIGALYVIIWLLGYFAHVVIPVAIALLLAALMAPGVGKLVEWRVPRSLATAIVLVGGLAVVGGVLTFVITEFTNGLPQLQSQVNDSLDTIQNWLSTGPLHLRQDQIKSFLQNAIDTIKANQSAITSGAITTAATIGEVLTGLLLTLFILIFFLFDGAGIWRFVVRGVPGIVRDRVDVAGKRGFSSLVSYVRATAAVAVFDAVGIGIGLWIVGVPLFVPLAALVFLTAFIPIIGALIAGTVAVLIALVANGFISSLIVLAIVIGIMQIESHVLQPWLLGRAVKLHPLAVVLAIGVGLIAAGIAGALLSVPLLAVLNAGVRSLVNEGETDPDDVDVLDDAASQPNVVEDDEESEADADEDAARP
ncbi:AI-2E family transporter [Actinokineospora globicatena]|uniref:AI-2E family transporter n=1 Tax=Actinokineospora globicatena TaxID=103729 RepID=A0A9W6VAN5_9PSEU|nr:AI-2E family transporter [Actinokineospora globicatena]MCP2301288.1 putative PurR-regulated permease PerM [Actinokineospora globicatena]GLW77073.1 AI-2E family transporter [Actinokineospora globicatena]GLW83907.1 AI-2E family transporter [Actinokineospora globicatena]GLW92148.1 AI-2E family transporter [Actinokineospora globicatena]